MILNFDYFFSSIIPLTSNYRPKSSNGKLSHFRFDFIMRQFSVALKIGDNFLSPGKLAIIFNRLK